MDKELLENLLYYIREAKSLMGRGWCDRLAGRMALTQLNKAEDIAEALRAAEQDEEEAPRWTWMD